jgi:serine/threonine protein kinase
MAEPKPGSARFLTSHAAAERVVLSDDARQELEQFCRSHETLVLTIFFSDLVGSTRLQTERGNLRAADLVQRHYTLMRDVLSGFDGREIRTAGDSMLIVFAAPSEAVKFGLYAQRAMRAARDQEADMPAMRAGVHQGQVVLELDRRGTDVVDVYGLQVSTAARIMDLAAGGQMLLSRSVFDDARAILGPDDFAGFRPLGWCNHGPYRFQGVEDNHEVCEAGEAGEAVLAPPPASGKGWPAERATEELGWRPAAGVTVPESNWVLVQKLGEGAFGEVWKAFNASDKSHQVFKFCFKRDRLPALKREARLLKRLRKYAHPSLVEVYDVTEGERPPHYLEMEYVDGPPLRAWLSAEPPLRERLEVVAQVADALDTVHAAGIFHRDIKPANILLTFREDGAIRAKLTDFGLGATQDPEFLKSISDSRGEGVVGTWDYIAPEVRHGGKASAQSDIYSLGLTLYQVAVGDLDRPLTGDWEMQLESDVLREDIRRCVCQTPQDRWPRAAELAQALRSHDQRRNLRTLERQREEHRARARRLRRAAGVATVAAAVLLALGGLAAYQWAEAARQRDRALAQKRLAMDAINRLTHDVPQRLRSVPGALPVAKAVLEENLVLLDRILELEPDTFMARRERGVNLLSIGDRWMLVGDTARAREAYDKSLQIARELATAHPLRSEFRRDVAMAWDRVGDACLAMGQSNAALDAYNQSLAISQTLADERSGEASTRRDLALALDKLGRVSVQMGQTDQAAEHYQRALEIAIALAQAAPDDPQAQRDLGLCYERIGDLRTLQGRHEAALAAFETCLELGQRDMAARPDVPEVIRGLSVTYDKLGRIYLTLGRDDEARQAYERSLDLIRGLAQREPENVQLLRDVSVGLDRLGDICLQAGRAEEALERFEAGMVIGRQLAARDPLNAAAQFDLLAGQCKLGNAHLALDHRREALAAYRDGLTLGQQLAAADPHNTEVQRSLSVLQSKIGTVHLLDGQTDEAIAAFEAATAAATRLAEADPASVQAQRDLAVCHHRMMLAYETTGDLERWREASRRTIDAFQNIHTLSGDDPAAARDLARVLAQAGDGLLTFPEPSTDDVQLALTWARRCLELGGQSDAESWKRLAQLQNLAGDGPGAMSSIERARANIPDGPDGQALRAEVQTLEDQFRQRTSAAK